MSLYVVLCCCLQAKKERSEERATARNAVRESGSHHSSQLQPQYPVIVCDMYSSFLLLSPLSSPPLPYPPGPLLHRQSGTGPHLHCSNARDSQCTRYARSVSNHQHPPVTASPTHPPPPPMLPLSCTAVVDRDILRYGAVKKKGEAECVFIREMHFVEMTCLNMRVGVRFWR